MIHRLPVIMGVDLDLQVMVVIHHLHLQKHHQPAPCPDLDSRDTDPSKVQTVSLTKGAKLLGVVPDKVSWQLTLALTTRRDAIDQLTTVLEGAFAVEVQEGCVV